MNGHALLALFRDIWRKACKTPTLLGAVPLAAPLSPLYFNETQTNVELGNPV